jgi:FkbM family methyltransferase
VFLLFSEIFLRGCYTSAGFYEPAAGDTVIDCGANIGVFALYLATKTRNIRIHCFEPSGSTFQQLEVNIKANKLENVASIYQEGLWPDHTERVLLGYDNSGRRSFYRDRRERIAGTSEKVKCISLGTAIEKCGRNLIDFLKIDIEGAELEIVEGADSKEWDKVKRVALEYHEELRPGSKNRLLKHLASNGFNQIFVTQLPAPLVDSIGIIQAIRS